MNTPLSDAAREGPSRRVMAAGAVIAALVLLILLGACAPTAQRNGPPAITATTTAAAPIELAPELAARAPAPEITVPPVDTDPEQVVGLDAAGVAALLGSPGMVRREGPAQVWQYSRKGCIVDLFLYTDETGGPFSVVYYELREGQGGTALTVSTAQRGCFAGLLERPGTV